MLSYKIVTLALWCMSASAAPILRREVPQEHSHEQFLTTVRASLATNNPNEIVDPVFGLLGDAAGAAGLGKLTDVDCLQQATADQAFTNAKAAGDVTGMTAALIYRGLERNTATVGGASALCTETPVNAEIAAITQHQDPASTGAAATNKGVTLALAKQIAAIGGDPTTALKSGTFAPGSTSDNTGKGNTCDTTDDPVGCIFTQNLLVEDATEAEVSAAVAGVAVSTGAAVVASTTDAAASTTVAAASTSVAAAVTTAAADASCPAPTTVTVTAAAATSVAAAVTTSAATAATTTAAATSSGANLQTFTGTVGGSLPPAVTAGGRGFAVAGEDASTESFLNLSAALQRSCSVQNNACSDAANSGQAAGVTVGDCGTQETACNAAASA